MKNVIGTGGFGAVILALGLAACVDPVCGCSPAFPEVYGSIDGRVFTPDSVPVVGALVAIDVGPGSCEEAREEIVPHDGESRAGGHYTVAFSSYIEIEDPCLRVSATPPAGSDLIGSDFTYVPIEEGQAEVYAEVDLYLRTSP